MPSLIGDGEFDPCQAGSSKCGAGVLLSDGVEGEAGRGESPPCPKSQASRRMLVEFAVCEGVGIFYREIARFLEVTESLLGISEEAPFQLAIRG